MGLQGENPKKQSRAKMKRERDEWKDKRSNPS